MTASRLPNGGRVDRGRTLSFTFDGVNHIGLAGDTLASALLAADVRVVGRSFKYHRPRGIYSAGPEEPNALVTLGAGGSRAPNLPATTVELVEGLRAESQNRWPSLRFDLQALNGAFAPLLAAGFYYKTFMGPTRRSWMFYERFIRRAAGLGRAGVAPDWDSYETRHEFADVAVVGAGPAGLAAALTAARSGARVILIEQDFLLGGGLLGQPADGPAAAWLASIEAELDAFSNVVVLKRTTAFGVYDDGTIGLTERRDHEPSADGRARQCLCILRARAIVFATGAIERPLVFAHNDRPRVMLASAAGIYLNRFAVLPGSRVVVATGNHSAYATANDLAAAGARVTVVDARPVEVLGRLAPPKAIEVRSASRIVAVRGHAGVHTAEIATIDGGNPDPVACDLVCVSGGWTPTVHLTSHLGAKPRYRDDIGGFVPDALRPGSYAAGAVNGSFDSRAAVAEGADAGRRAAEHCGWTPPATPIDPPAVNDQSLAAPESLSVAASRGKAFIDLQNDVTADDVRLAHREGYRSVEHLKRYTTQGMGTDQGKTSNLNALALMAELRAAPIPAVGTTTFRPPYTPVTIGALAGRGVGRHFKPVRRTPMHDWHVANGAEMLAVGLWMRPWFYRAAGATVDEAYVAEMRTVREAAGIVDISTLGKIEVQGPDAAAFLDRVYVNTWSNLAVGRARYGVMLRDDGIVFDDGTTARLDRERYFMTTSTAKAGDVMSWLEFLLHTAWPDLRVVLTSVTDDWAAMSVAGPNSRAILAAAFPAADISDAMLPHMGVIAIEAAGIAIRIARLSYSGERAYEIYAPSSRGLAVWERLLAAGTRFGLRPYGVEALGALRVEKGHVAGPEIDGRTTLADLALDRLASRTKPFVGNMLAKRPAFLDPTRPRLIGLECIEAGKRLRSGAVLFADGDRLEGHGRGRITSTTYSPTLGKWIGLGLYAGGMAHENTEILASYPMKDELVRTRIVSPMFLDQGGARLHG